MTELAPSRLRAPGGAADRVSIVLEAQAINQAHHPLVGIEPRSGEPDRLPEVTLEMAVGFLDVRHQKFLGQLVKPATPHDVIHAAMQAELVALPLHVMKHRHERESHRTRQGRLQKEPGPAGLLDEVDGIPIGELGPGAGKTLPQPFAQVGRAAHVDEEGVGDSEVTADGANFGDSVGDADPMIHVPAEHEELFAHRAARAPNSPYSSSKRAAVLSQSNSRRARARPAFPIRRRRSGSSSSDAMASASA